jgi:hypothetical protein
MPLFFVPHSPFNFENLVEEADDLARHVLATGLLLVHDTGGGGEDNVAELTSGEQLDNPLLELGEADVVTGRDDTALVEAAVELDDDLAGAVVIDLGELANVAVLLHNLEELDNDLRGGADHDLALAALLGIVERVEGIVEDGSADHLGGIVGWRFSNRERKEVSANFEQLAFRRLEEHGECPR